MPRIPSLTPRDVVRILKKIGYSEYRQKGSHLIMIKENSIIQPVIPMHTGDIKRGTLRAIIRQVGLTPDGFLQLL